MSIKFKRPLLYSIAVFEDTIVSDIVDLNISIKNSKQNLDGLDDMQNISVNPINLEEREDILNEKQGFNSCKNKIVNQIDDIGNRLRLLGFITDTSEVVFIGKDMFKEFLLAGLRKLAGQYDSSNINGVDTYEFDIPMFGTYAAYIETRDIIKENHKRLITVIVSSSNYPREFRLTVAERILNFVGEGSKTSIDIQKKMLILLKQFYTMKHANRMKDIRKELKNTNDVMRGNVEKLVAHGEQIEELVKKSDTISSKSKIAYNRAKKTNSKICTIL